MNIVKFPTPKTDERKKEETPDVLSDYEANYRKRKEKAAADRRRDNKYVTSFYGLSSRSGRSGKGPDDIA